MINLIVATTIDNAIGINNNLVHADPLDLKHFRNLTINQVVIMGRKTWDSLPVQPLTNRVNLVVSSKTLSLEDACYKAKSRYPDTEIFIIGGASIYKQALDLNLVDRIYRTEFQCYAPAADTFFPPIPDNFTLMESIPDFTTIVDHIQVPMYFEIWEKDQPISYS